MSWAIPAIDGIALYQIWQMPKISRPACCFRHLKTAALLTSLTAGTAYRLRLRYQRITGLMSDFGTTYIGTLAAHAGQKGEKGDKGIKG